MNKNFVFLVMMIMALVFGLTVVGCDNDTTSKDIWSNLTSFEQMNGTWKSTYSQNNKPIKDIVEGMGIPWDSSMEAMFGNMKVTIKADITLIIDANARTMAMAMKPTAAFSGGNVNLLWMMVVKPYLEDPEFLENLESQGISNVKLDDKKHSITMDISYLPDEMSDDDIEEMLNSGLQINQSGTKIKVPPELIEELGIETPELIFTKQ